jgi:acetyl esterase/lipase
LVIAHWALIVPTAALGLTLDLWPGPPPGPVRDLPPESDTTTPSDPLVAGRPVVRLGNVATPQITLHRPPADLDTGASVIICPGGGYHILAYDLEGEEVARWFAARGVTGIVLKYRVPLRGLPGPIGEAAIQDTRRALALVRENAAAWGLDPKRVGVCGFSAGGHSAAYAALAAPEPTSGDTAVPAAERPDFALLVYADGWMARDSAALKPGLAATAATPPVFMAIAFDDPYTPIADSLTLTRLLQAAGGRAELHVFATGGHGFGVRRTEEPITQWPDLALAWLKSLGMLKP